MESLNMQQLRVFMTVGDGIFRAYSKERDAAKDKKSVRLPSIAIADLLEHKEAVRLSTVSRMDPQLMRIRRVRFQQVVDSLVTKGLLEEKVMVGDSESRISLTEEGEKDFGWHDYFRRKDANSE